MSDSTPLRILSLGAGVQSTALALMSARGDLPRIDYAIFADTGGEPRAVYDHLERLEAQLPFPVIRARRPGPDLAALSIQIAQEPVTRSAMPPWFLAEPGSALSMLPRQCSKEFKTRVVVREIRRLLGIGPGERGPKHVAVEQWLGISTDEMQRMKDAEQKYIRNVFPLVDARMSRRNCLEWMRERQIPAPPKSSCVFCPYRGNAQWRDMRDNAPADWATAVAIDAAIRPGFHGMSGEAFVHKDRKPLDQVDLSTAEDRGQLNMFLDECEGRCGV